MNLASYQSPIDLQQDQVSFLVRQILKIKGNHACVEVTSDKIYDVLKFNIVLNVKSALQTRKYLLHEYHFHAGEKSEHAINGTKQDAEMHIVFRELGEGQTHKDHVCSDLCGKGGGKGGNYLVIGYLVKFGENDSIHSLGCLQAQSPNRYFVYDGTLTAPTSDKTPNDFPPVRWLVSTKKLTIPKTLFNSKNSKTSRKLQSLDGRLVLFVD